MLLAVMDFLKSCLAYCDDAACPDNMLCNSEGNCICNDGFSGPDCFIATGIKSKVVPNSLIPSNPYLKF